MRLTIERMRSLVLGAGLLLIALLVGFLVAGRWKHRFLLHEIPKRLGIDITQEANGYTFSHAFGAHSQYKIHASKVVQLKQGKAVLHDVQIELYGEDGSRVDRIVGAEFDYDQKAGIATAAGPVEITLMRPTVAPAVAPNATAGRVLGDKARGTALGAAAQTASTGEIHVKTSGLTFVQQTGMASTAARVEFAIAQGSGSAMGASFDSQAGHLMLDHAVELNVHRASDNVVLTAQHAEFERGDLLCNLQGATARFRNGAASAGRAVVAFRPDGSAIRLDATSGFSVTTAADAHVAAPTGSLEFDDHNQPRHARLEGGVTMDSNANGRQVAGSAPTAQLEFTSGGDLRHAHLERGVTMHTEATSVLKDSAKGGALKEVRDWRSPVADVDFHDAGQGRIVVAAIHGTGGVVIAALSQRGTGPALPSRMAADEVTGQFSARQELTSLIGVGHASMEQTTAAGARQKTSGDRLEAHFAPAANRPRQGVAPIAKGAPDSVAGSDAAAVQIQSVTLDGDVLLEQDPPGRAEDKHQQTLRATAGRAVYEGAGEWLHLTVGPRVEDGGLQLSADKVDVSQLSGDAFAKGSVKASWLGGAQANGGQQANTRQGSTAFGGQGPAHVVASEAQLHESSGEATFRGQVRLWQQGNSISAPVLVLDRTRQTLVARSTTAADPVRVVLVSAANLGLNPAGGSESGKSAATARPSGPSVIRVRGSDLKYSEAERKVVMRAREPGSVVAETGTSTSMSSEVELILLSPGNHAGKDGGSAQVDRMTARGHVTVSSQGRRGTGEQLVYSSETGEYVLTGSAAAPPKVNDPSHGTVTGEALVFNSRDDSVNIEGGGQQTTTNTTAPK